MVAQALGGWSVRADDAHQEVGMPANHLGCAVDNDVGTQRERLLQERRRKGAIDGEQRCLVETLGNRSDIGDLHQRVAGRLDPDEVGTLRCIEDCFGVGLIDKVNVGAATLGALAELAPETHVERVWCDDRATDRHQVEHSGGGGDTTREGNRLATLKLAHHLFEGRPRVVTGASITQLAARTKRAVEDQRRIERRARPRRPAALHHRGFGVAFHARRVPGCAYDRGRSRSTRAVVMSSPKRECLPDRKPLIP